MLRLILDLVILLIVVFCAWRGLRSGLIAGVLAACAVLFSFYAADILADTYSGEFTRMLEPFVSGVVDSAYSAAEEALSALTSVLHSSEAVSTASLFIVTILCPVPV